jgi:serine/threonine protein kinase
LIRYLLEPWKVDPAQVSYILDKEIGARGYGRVYEGRLGIASVAVKVVSAALMSADVMLKADILREVSLLAELRHPCIVEFRGAYWPDAVALELADAHSAEISSDSDEKEDRGAGGPKRGKPGSDPSRAFIVMELLFVALWMLWPSTVCRREMCGRHFMTLRKHCASCTAKGLHT